MKLEEVRTLSLLAILDHMVLALNTITCLQCPIDQWMSS
jgi:hypothetical protein